MLQAPTMARSRTNATPYTGMSLPGALRGLHDDHFARGMPEKAGNLTGELNRAICIVLPTQ